MVANMLTLNDQQLWPSNYESSLCVEFMHKVINKYCHFACLMLDMQNEQFLLSHMFNIFNYHILQLIFWVWIESNCTVLLICNCKVYNTLWLTHVITKVNTDMSQHVVVVSSMSEQHVRATCHPHWHVVLTCCSQRHLCCLRRHAVYAYMWPHYVCQTVWVCQHVSQDLKYLISFGHVSKDLKTKIFNLHWVKIILF